MSLSIEIFNCSAVLFNGTSPVEAHAGSSFSILKWMAEQLSIRGRVHVSGWHKLGSLRQREEEAAARAEEARQSSINLYQD